MSFLDGLAIVVLTFVVLTTIALVAALGALPGYIARQRSHPHAQAISLAGWLGLVFVPLWPLALIWTYVEWPRSAVHVSPELEELRYRVNALEEAIHMREAAE